MRALLERLEILESKGEVFVEPGHRDQDVNGITMVPAEKGSGGDYAKRSSKPESWVLWRESGSLDPVLIGVMDKKRGSYTVKVAKMTHSGGYVLDKHAGREHGDSDSAIREAKKKAVSANRYMLSRARVDKEGGRCAFCGRDHLKKVVWMHDRVEGGEKCFGTTCAGNVLLGKKSSAALAKAALRNQAEDEFDVFFDDALDDAKRAWNPHERDPSVKDNLFWNTLEKVQNERKRFGLKSGSYSEKQIFDRVVRGWRKHLRLQPPR